MLTKMIVVAAAAAALVFGSVSPAAGEAAPGDATRGKSLFLRPGVFCGSCHTLKAARSTGRDGPDLDTAKLGYAKIVESITTGHSPSKRWPTGMPGYGGKHAMLTTALIRDLAAFVYTSTHS